MTTFTPATRWLCLLTVLLLPSCRREAAPATDAGAAAPVTRPASAAPRAQEPRAAPRQNLILFTIDTLRANHLGCYGYFRETSPNIDAIAREALLFERCFVPMAQTLPSHLSIMTGVYPMEHGVLSNLEKPGGQRFAPGDNMRPIAMLLGEQGYRCAAFVSATPVKKSSGIAHGFDTFDEPERARRLGGETVTAFLSWLEQSPPEPFFAWIHVFDPHAPYEPPAPYDTMFSSDVALDAYMQERRIAEHVQKQRNDRHVVPEDDLWDIRKAINGYDGEIRYVDDQIARLVERLKERHLWDRTVFVLTADHGEGLGQHDIVMHDAIWDEQLHVPLVIRAPGAAAAKIARPVRSIDILPTVLSLMGGIDASAFLAQCRGRNALTAASEEPVFAQEPDGRRKVFALMDGDWKYIHDADKGDQLFHLGRDPFELTNVIADHPQEAARLKQQIVELMREQARRGAILQEGRAADDAAEPDEKRQEELRALGYLGDEEDTERNHDDG